MLKNKIKAIKIGFLLVCILPTISQALDKEDMLKYLFKSTYPEVKVIDENSEESNKEDKETSNSEENANDKATNDEEEYVNIYIGEENKPQTDSTEEVSTILEKDYVNDLRVTKDNPQILIYHTHSSETYSDSPQNNYHSKDKEHSVIEVGSLLSTELTQKGWGVVHSTTYNDLSYNESYVNSAKTAKSVLSKYDSIKIAIDLHRDGQSIKDESSKKTIHDKYTTEINGETVAKFFFVVGQRNSNVAELKKQAKELTDLAEEKYPGLVAPVVTKQYGRFNQYIADNCLLIEIGNNATSTEESKATTKYVAEILDEYYNDEK